MKKTIIIICMLLATVIVVPMVNSEPLMTKIENRENFEILKGIIIEKIGYDKYNMTYDNISEIIDRHVPNPKTLPIDITIFKDWCTIIISFMMLMFGHNIIGEITGVTMAFILLVIPVFVASFVICLDESRVVIGEFVLDRLPDNLIEQYGIIGCAIMLLFALPFLAVLYVIALPVLTVGCTISLMIEILEYGVNNA